MLIGAAVPSAIIDLSINDNDELSITDNEIIDCRGDAIMHELLPAVEEQFRGIGEGWARYDTTNPCATVLCQDRRGTKSSLRT